MPNARSASQSRFMACQLCRDFLLVLDIVEVAKPSLQVTERGDKGLVSLTVLGTSKKFREELGSVSQLLSFDPGSVTLLRRELFEMTAMLLELAATSPEYAGCEVLDVLITRSLALRFVRSTPWAGLNPGD